MVAVGGHAADDAAHAGRNILHAGFHGRFSGHAHHLLQAGLTAAALRPLIGTDAVVPAADGLPVGDFARVDGRHLIEGQVRHRVAAVDEEHEGLPPDGGQVELHAGVLRRQLLADGGLGDEDHIRPASDQVAVGVRGAAAQHGLPLPEAVIMWLVDALRIHRLHKGRIDGIKGGRTVDDEAVCLLLGEAQGGFLRQRGGLCAGEGLVLAQRKPAVIHRGDAILIQADPGIHTAAQRRCAQHSQRIPEPLFPPRTRNQQDQQHQQQSAQDGHDPLQVRGHAHHQERKKDVPRQRHEQQHRNQAAPRDDGSDLLLRHGVQPPYSTISPGR